MNAAIHGFIVKINHAIQGTMIGNSTGIHSKCLNTVKHRTDPIRTVQKTVFTVHVQMRECHEKPPFLLKMRFNVYVGSRKVSVTSIGRTRCDAIFVSKTRCSSGFQVSYSYQYSRPVSVSTDAR